jgi:hypothetical protein
MPDISMCTGASCAQRNECYRARAIPSEHRQSYFTTPPVKADGSCAYRMPLYPGDRLTPEFAGETEEPCAPR